jgi:anti-sigma regulatory factor (Ser/Thr protein kinase)
MKELSLHILDIATNSIDAGSSLIKISVLEKTLEDSLKIIIEDDGRGIKKEKIKEIQNPFYTTRKVRNVGLGLPFLKLAAERCDGEFKIESKENIGTKVCAKFKRSHIDRAPLGKIEETILTLLNFSENFDLIYVHELNNHRFLFDTREIKEILETKDIKEPKVLIWLRGFIKENLEELMKYN